MIDREKPRKNKKTESMKPLRVINALFGWFIMLSVAIIGFVNNVWWPPFEIRMALFVGALVIVVVRSIYVAITTSKDWQPTIKWYIAAAIPWGIMAFLHARALCSGDIRLFNWVAFTIYTANSECYLFEAYRYYKRSKKTAS